MAQSGDLMYNTNMKEIYFNEFAIELRADLVFWFIQGSTGGVT